MQSNTLSPAERLIPKPAFVQEKEGSFFLTPQTKILLSSKNEAVRRVGEYLAGLLAEITGHRPEIAQAGGPDSGRGIYLTIEDEDPSLGKEGYSLQVESENVSLAANRAAGLFYGAQTMRQLLETRGEKWAVRAVIIRDYPRFSWRGAMLDVARSFFTVEEVKRLIDLLACYKINRLHLHLTDDQGWRIEIKKWPNLTAHGGNSAVKGGRPGFYTQEDYSEIVRYAKSRQITIVPEIDLPGHTFAALASYPELNEDGQAVPLYNDIKVGLSSLAVHKEITYRFVTDVLTEIAKITPGPYLHVGGDEALSTTAEDYAYFMSRLQPIVAALDKTLVGWGEISRVPLQPGSIVQIWQRNNDAAVAAAQDVKIIMSPSYHTYLDMKYNASTSLGLDWAGLIEVEDAYNWEPTEIGGGVSAEKIVGVEAPLWAETIRTLEDIEYMYFPRILGQAEIGWSPRKGRSWEEYRRRLAAHGPSLEKMKVNFYRSPQIDWQ